MENLIAAFCPELRSLPPADRGDALRAARRIPYDSFELLGIAVGLIVATLFLTHALEGAADIGTRILAACPVAAVAIGPFLLRRIRRGLRRIAERA